MKLGAARNAKGRVDMSLPSASEGYCQQLTWSKKKCLISLLFVTVGVIVVLGNYAGHSYVSISFGSTNRGEYSNHISSPIRDYTTQYGSESTRPQWTNSTMSGTFNACVHETIENDVHNGSHPLSRKFLVYVYNSFHEANNRSSTPISELTSSLVNDLQLGNSWTDDPASACIFVVVVGLWRDTISSGDVSTMIHSLPHWKEYSHRHVLVELLYSNNVSRILQKIEADSALLATSYLPIQNANSHILIPPVVTSQVENTVIPPTGHLMSQRTIFSLYFEGELEDQQRSEADSKLFGVCEHFSSNSSCSFKCNASRERGALEREWSLCNTATDRLAKCQKALFALVPCGMEGEVGPVTFTRLIEALQCRAVPIVVGDCVNRLPFSEVIEWKEAAIVVPPEELSPNLLHVHNSQKNIRKYKERGLFLYTTYFSSGLKIVESLIAILRNRSGYSPMWYRDYISETLLNTMPRKPTIPPPQHFQYPQQMWNSPPGPFYSHAYIPEQSSTLDNQLPSSSAQLSEEKFTMVILTYHRVKGLMNLLVRLKNCPHLDKVVVVWNNEPTFQHPKEFKWPDIGVPVEVVRGEGNSLNNRFLPFSNIETDAVLSFDDDLCPTPKDIVNGFRVWQEHRTRLVGWPARRHRLIPDSSGGWQYEYRPWDEKTCNHSLVLTGGAFFHKYYAYLYSYWMPERVRSFVKNNLNCEDLAMNFLTAHITRSPPVWIGDKKTPVCPYSGYPSGISLQKGHWKERCLCLNLFEKAYGYMPLLISNVQAIHPYCIPK